MYELGKFVCVQAGTGVKEDQKGNAFMKWCLLNDHKDQLLVHLRMKPVVGTRYYVYHYNPGIIFLLRPLYLDFIEFVRTFKSKPGLNKLESSIKRLLEDDPALGPSRDPTKRPSKRPLQYDPLRDGASDQIRLGVAKPKKFKTRIRKR